MKIFLASLFLLFLPLSVTFDGTYKLDNAASDNIDTAIEQGIKGLSFLVRPFARSRVKKLNPAYQTVSIASSAGEIRIAVENQPALKMRTDGSAVVWSSPEGGKANVKARFENGHLLQEFDSPDGRRVNDYTLSADGRILTMLVTETSARLSAPIKYKQVYRRVT